VDGAEITFKDGDLRSVGTPGQVGPVSGISFNTAAPQDLTGARRMVVDVDYGEVRHHKLDSARFIVAIEPQPRPVVSAQNAPLIIPTAPVPNTASPESLQELPPVSAEDEFKLASTFLCGWSGDDEEFGNFIDGLFPPDDPLATKRGLVSCDRLHGSGTPIAEVGTLPNGKSCVDLITAVGSLGCVGETSQEARVDRVLRGAVDNWLTITGTMPPKFGYRSQVRATMADGEYFEDGMHTFGMFPPLARSIGSPALKYVYFVAEVPADAAAVELVGRGVKKTSGPRLKFRVGP
jgi:hypothetical protein